MSGAGTRLSNLPTRATLGGLGVTELVLSTLSTPTRLVDLLGTAAESDLLGTALATVSLVGTELAVAADLAGLLFFGYAVWEFLPRVFPAEFESVTSRLGYQLLAVVFVLATTDLVAQLGRGTRSWTSRTGLVVGFALSAGLLSIGYVASVAARGTDLSAPADVAGAQMTANEDRDTSEMHPLRRQTGRVIVVGITAALPLAFLPPVVAAAGRLYPIPELLAIGWGAVGVVERRSSRSITDHLPNRERTDVEDSGFDLIVNAVRSPKGLSVLAVILAGFAGGTTLFAAFGSNAGRFLDEAITTANSQPLFAWSVFGTVVAIPTASLYAVWFWVRAIERTPRYLHAWNEAHVDASPLADETLPGPVARPAGLLVPVAVTLVPAVAVTQLLKYDYFFGLRSLLVAGYAVVWPLSILLLGWCVVRTRRLEPQPPASDGTALLAALLVEWGAFLALVRFVPIVASGAGIPYRPPVGVGGFLLALGMVVFLFVYPDVNARSDAADGWRGSQQYLFMFGTGLACGLAALVGLLPRFQLMLVSVGVVFVGGAVWGVASDAL